MILNWRWVLVASKLDILSKDSNQGSKDKLQKVAEAKDAVIKTKWNAKLLR